MKWVQLAATHAEEDARGAGGDALRKPSGLCCACPGQHTVSVAPLSCHGEHNICISGLCAITSTLVPVLLPVQTRVLTSADKVPSQSQEGDNLVMSSGCDCCDATPGVGPMNNSRAACHQFCDQYT